MIDLEKLNTFLEVLKGGSFAAAGRSLGLSTAAVSKQIAALEQQLGVTLLERSTRKVEMTEAGELLRGEARELFRLADQTVNLIQTLKKEPAGALHVTCNPYFAAGILLPKLPEFLKKYPKIELHFEIAERIPDMRKEGVDVLVGMSIPGHPDAAMKRLATTRYVLVGAPSYFKKRGKPLKPQQLAEHAIITHSMRRPADVLDLGEHQIPFEPLIYVNEVSALKALALQGVGLALMHEYIVEKELKAGKLVEVLSKWTRKDVAILLNYFKTKVSSPKVEAFVRFVEECYAKH